MSVASNVMKTSRQYRTDLATLEDGQLRHVVVDSEGRLHVASLWLSGLGDVRAFNTTKSYGQKVAHYLSWAAGLLDWRAASLSDLQMWRRSLASGGTRGVDTLANYIVAVRSFYEWAGAHGMLTTDLLDHLVQRKYFPPGTAGGGEHGSFRTVTNEKLRDSREGGRKDAVPWIDDQAARDALETLPLTAKDRFVIDLLYYTGIRAGEALSLFTADMHFGGGSRALRCPRSFAHFHVRDDNPVENGAHVKGRPRVIPVDQHLVDRYIDYVTARTSVLTREQDRSPHVLVNMETRGQHRGRAMSDSGLRDLVKKCGDRIDFSLSGAHVLRHTLATRLVRGIDCEPQPRDAVSKMLGHRNRKSIEVYLHTTEADLINAARAVAPRRLRNEE